MRKTHTTEIIFLLSVIALLISGCTRSPQRLYYLFKYNNDFTETAADSSTQSLKKILEENSEYKFYEGNSLIILKTGDEVLNRMFELISSAKKEICVDQYIFRNDETGREFFEILEKKAKQGVRVRVIIDKLGSLGPSMHFVKKLKFSKMKVRFYNPVVWWSIVKINNRDHNKVLIVDSDTAVVSGIGLGKEYKYWRDIGVEIRGPVIYDIIDSFERTWVKAGYGWFGKDIPLPIINTLKLGVDSIFHKAKRPDSSLKNNLAGKCTARLLYGTPDFYSRTIFETILKSINSANKYIYITNAYFVPNSIIRNALIKAAERGIDVRIILPHKSDLPILRRTSQTYYTDLLCKGIKIFELREKILHAKYMVVDDRWATIGSSNILDRASFMNIETNIESLDSEFAISLRKIFYDDLENSDEIKYENWKKRSSLKKIADFFVFPSVLLY